MRGISKLLRTSTYIIASVVLGASFTASNSKAAIIDLGFALDSSGSVSQSDFTSAAAALADALAANIPVGGPDTYRISVVTFASTAQTVITQTINNAGDLTAVQTAVTGAAYLGTNTCISCATVLLTANINALGVFGDLSLINITTDGQPNEGTTNAGTLRTVTLAAGWDGISSEAVGAGADTAFLAALAAPGVGLIVNDPNLLPNPANQGFVLTLTDFAAYNAAIGAKVQNIVNPNETPIPGALPLFATGLGAIGFLTWRRKRNVAQAS